LGVSRGASTGSYAIALPSRQQIVHRGGSAQSRFRAGGLSSFRTYPASLSAGYRGFRSGENQSSLGKRPRFPDGAGFSPNASDKRAPGSPQPGAVLLQICCARSHVLCRPMASSPSNPTQAGTVRRRSFTKSPVAGHRPSACSGVKPLRNTSLAKAASRQAPLAFRSLDPFRALREPDCRRVRTRLAAGGEWIRTFSSAPDGQRFRSFVRDRPDRP
jgi:hypothetical protein